MAVIQVIQSMNGVGGSLSSKYSDETIMEKFAIRLNAQSTNLPVILTQAHAFAPTLFPGRGQGWLQNPTYGLFAKRFDFNAVGGLCFNYDVDVHYLPLDPGEQNTENGDNPLEWPATHSLDWIEYDEAITEAYNVEALGPSTGPSGDTNAARTRAAMTLGPVVNGALQELDEGLFEANRDAVINIHKNVATLEEIIWFNKTFYRTTNNADFLGSPLRTAKFLIAEAQGPQRANGIDYYAMTIRIQISKSTDRKLLSVGFHHYFRNKEDIPQLTKYKVWDDEAVNEKGKKGAFVDVSEPGHIALDGTKSTTPTYATWRYLRETSYAGLLLP